MNKYPTWKYTLIFLAILIGSFYALPNIFGEYPSIEISTEQGLPIQADTVTQISTFLEKQNLPYESLKTKNDNLIIRFDDTDAQLKAKEALQALLGDKFIVASTLISDCPEWFSYFGASPMKLGLDLRGGIHLLYEVDTNSVLRERINNEVKDIHKTLRENRIHYTRISRNANENITIGFSDEEILAKAEKELHKRLPEFVWKISYDTPSKNYLLIGEMSPSAMLNAQQMIVEQTMTTLRKRVNELGVAEPIVQQQGANRIAIDLPGIQDPARAKSLIGKTATLELHLQDVEHDAYAAVSGAIPLDSSLYTYQNKPILLKNEVVLSGTSITNATATFDEYGRSIVSIRLGGGGEALFSKTTSENIGKPLAIVYKEVVSKQERVNGKPEITHNKVVKVISVPRIQTALGNSFQITGIETPYEASNLALLLRAGALPASLTIIEERLIGPSLGKQNIQMGQMSLIVGLLLVFVFTAVYYSVFGIIADIGLLFNLILTLGILSIIHATITLPGIAGIVLAIGMAVDGNVLIFERIREEIRNKVSPQTAISIGYEKAFATIVDANVTTLIAAAVLFGIGTGPIQGFAVTLTIGLLVSMFTSVTCTRAIVNLAYGSRRLKTVPVGKIKL